MGKKNKNKNSGSSLSPPPPPPYQEPDFARADAEEASEDDIQRVVNARRTKRQQQQQLHQPPPPRSAAAAAASAALDDEASLADIIALVRARRLLKSNNSSCMLSTVGASNISTTMPATLMRMQNLGQQQQQQQQLGITVSGAAGANSQNSLKVFHSAAADIITKPLALPKSKSKQEQQRQQEQQQLHKDTISIVPSTAQRRQGKFTTTDELWYQRWAQFFSEFTQMTIVPMEPNSHVAALLAKQGVKKDKLPDLYDASPFSTFGYCEAEQLRQQLQDRLGRPVLITGSPALGVARATPNRKAHPLLQVHAKGLGQIERTCLNMAKYGAKSEIRASSWDFVVLSTETLESIGAVSDSSSSSSDDDDGDDQKKNKPNKRKGKKSAAVSVSTAAQLKSNISDLLNKPLNNLDGFTMKGDVTSKDLKSMNIAISEEELYIAAHTNIARASAGAAGGGGGGNSKGSGGNKKAMNNTKSSQQQQQQPVGISSLSTRNLDALVRRGTDKASGIVRVLVAGHDWKTHPALSVAVLRNFVKSYPNLLVVLNAVRFWALTHGAAWFTRDLPPRKLFAKLRSNMVNVSHTGHRHIDDGEVSWRFFCFFKAYWNSSGKSAAGGDSATFNQVFNLGGLHPLLLDHLVVSILLRKKLIAVPEEIRGKPAAIVLGQFLQEKESLLRDSENFTSSVDWWVSEEDREEEGMCEGEAEAQNARAVMTVKWMEAVMEFLANEKEELTSLTEVADCVLHESEQEQQQQQQQQQNKKGSRNNKNTMTAAQRAAEINRSAELPAPMFLPAANNPSFNLADHVDRNFLNALRNLAVETCRRLRPNDDPVVLQHMIRRWNAEADATGDVGVGPNAFAGGGLAKEIEIKLDEPANNSKDQKQQQNSDDIDLENILAADPMQQISNKKNFARSYKFTDEPGFALLCHPECLISVHRCDYCQRCCKKVTSYSAGSKSKEQELLCNDCAEAELCAKAEANLNNKANSKTEADFGVPAAAAAPASPVWGTSGGGGGGGGRGNRGGGSRGGGRGGAGRGGGGSSSNEWVVPPANSGYAGGGGGRGGRGGRGGGNQQQQRPRRTEPLYICDRCKRHFSYDMDQYDLCIGCARKEDVAYGMLANKFGTGEVRPGVGGWYLTHGTSNVAMNSGVTVGRSGQDDDDEQDDDGLNRDGVCGKCGGMAPYLKGKPSNIFCMRCSM